MSNEENSFIKKIKPFIDNKVLLDDDEDLEDEDVEEGEEEGDEGTELGLYEKKEEEARAEVQEMFSDLIEKIEGERSKIDNLMKMECIFIAGKYRIELDSEMMWEISTMSRLNEIIQESGIYLNGYVDLGRELSPKFDFVKNLIVKFQENLNEEQARRFAIIQRDKNGRYFITRDLINYYLKGVHVHLSRIIAALSSAGDYIVTVPPQRSGGAGDIGGGGMDMTGDLSGGDIGIGGDGMGVGGVSPYANDSNWWDRGNRTNINRRGSRMIPKMRDFGDSGTV